MNPREAEATTVLLFFGSWGTVAFNFSRAKEASFVFTEISLVVWVHFFQLHLPTPSDPCRDYHILFERNCSYALLISDRLSFRPHSRIVFDWERRRRNGFGNRRGGEIAHRKGM